MTPPMFGITGWKNSGKTTLAARLIAELCKRGYVVSAIKHAHERFDIDQPGRRFLQAARGGGAAGGIVLAQALDAHARASWRTGNAIHPNRV